MAKVNKVQVSTSKANAGNNALKKDFSELEKMMADLNKKVSDMTQWWGGQTTEKFLQSYATATKEFTKNLNKLQEYGKKMVDSVKKQQDNDAAMAKSIGRR